MTKKEKEELKRELKAEIIQELKQEVNGKGKDFDFTSYKREVVSDDIAKAKAFIKTNKWYWYLPLIGSFIYMWQLNQFWESIDRGILRKNINKATLKWLWLDIPFFYIMYTVIVFNYYPLRTRAAIKKGIEMTEENIEA